MRAPTRSRCGPTSPRATGSTPTGPRSPATRWAATAPTSSRRSSPTCSPRRSRRWDRLAWASGLHRPTRSPAARRSNTNRMLGSVRNIPFLMWNAAQDELVPVASAQAQADSLDALGYRYEFDLFNPAEHLTLADQRRVRPGRRLPRHDGGRPQPGARHLRLQPDDGLPGRPDRRPATRTGSRELTLRNASGTAPLGTIDVRSRGFGVGDPTPSGTVHGRRRADRRRRLRRSRTPARRRPGGARRPRRSRTGSTSPRRTSPR